MSCIGDDMSVSHAATPTPVMPLVTQLPPMPAIAAKLMAMVTTPTTPFQALADLVRSDVAFATRVLRIANSPLMGGREVTSILHGLSILGSDRLNALVMTLALHHLAVRPRNSTSLQQRCWRHSIATAFLCEILAPYFSQSPDAAYTAGLIHDVGAIAIAHLYPAEYEAVLLRSESRDSQLSEEQAQFGVDHAEFGAELIDVWQLPSHFCHLLLDHHAPVITGNTLLSLLQQADDLSDQLGFSLNIASPQPNYDPELLPHWLPAKWRSPMLRATLLERINRLQCSLI